jgi:hypothetical protein
MELARMMELQEATVAEPGQVVVEEQLRGFVA